MGDAGMGKEGCLSDYCGMGEGRDRRQKAVKLWFRAVVLKVWSPAARASPGHSLDVHVLRVHLQHKKVCILRGPAVDSGAC